MRACLILIPVTAAVLACASASATVVFRPLGEVPDGLPDVRTQWAEIAVFPDHSIGPMPRPHSDVSQGAETGDPMFYIQMSGMLGRMGGRLVRCDPFSDTGKVTVTPDGTVEIDFSAADAIVDALQRAGAEPVWNIASFPKTMLDEKERPVHALLDQFVYQVTHHWNVRQKRGIRYFEYLNEPPGLDGPGFAVAAAAAHRADPTVKVGGPAVMGCPVDVLENAVKYCVDNGVPLGFISFHLYYEMPDGFVKHIENVERMLARYPSMKDLEILITEWGVDAGMNGSCDTLYNAAYYSSILEAVMDRWPRVRPMHFQFRDGWDPHGPSRDFWGRWGMVTYPHLIPKPVYNAALMWESLSGTRVKAVSSDPSVRVVAAKGEHEVTILIWSWPAEYLGLLDKAIHYPSSPLDIPVRIRMERLPFASGGVRYTRQVVDQTHSNALSDPASAHLHTAQDIILSRSGREAHEDMKLIEEGSFEATFMLPLHAVTLITLRPEERPPVNVVARADRFRIWTGEKALVTIEPRYDEHLDLELLRDPAGRDLWKVEMVSRNPLSFSVEPPPSTVKTMRYFNAWVRSRTGGAIGQAALEFQTDSPAFLRRDAAHIDASVLSREAMAAVEAVGRTPGAREMELVWEAPPGIRVVPARETVRLRPGAAATAEARVSFGADLRPDRYLLTARLLSGGTVVHALEVPVTLPLASPRARRPVVIDGRLDDWDGVPSVTAASVADFDGFLRRDWGGEGDISGTVWTQWDEQNLYFAFRVRDDHHVQHVTTWEMKDFDSVHLGLDLGRDSTDPEQFFDRGDCDYVFGYLDGEAHVYRHWGAQRSMGAPEGGRVAAVKDGDTITFEVAMSWEQEFVPFAQPKAGSVLGCSVYFLDYDEGRHPGEMRWGRGLHWHKMRPALFNSIQLTD